MVPSVTELPLALLLNLMLTTSASAVGAVAVGNSTLNTLRELISVYGITTVWNACLELGKSDSSIPFSYSML